MTLSKFRGWLYFIAKMLGDVSAVKNNRISRRIGWRLAGKQTSKALNKIFR